MRILIIGNEIEFSRLLKHGLSQHGYAADYVINEKNYFGYIQINHESFDMLILDCIALGTRGISLCANLRQKGIPIPILVLSDQDTPEEIIHCLDSGADDYITKPLRFNELLARIRALLRRPKTVMAPNLSFGDVMLNPLSREVYCGGQLVEVTLKEFCLLEYFMRHPNQVLTREQLLDHAWDFSYSSISNVVDVHVKNLRRKLSPAFQPPRLETVRGVGYRLRV